MQAAHEAEKDKLVLMAAQECSIKALGLRKVLWLFLLTMACGRGTTCVCSQSIIDIENYTSMARVAQRLVNRWGLRARCRKKATMACFECSLAAIE